MIEAFYKITVNLRWVGGTGGRTTLLDKISELDRTVSLEPYIGCNDEGDITYRACRITAVKRHMHEAQLLHHQIITIIKESNIAEVDNRAV